MVMYVAVNGYDPELNVIGCYQGRNNLGIRPDFQHTQWSLFVILYVKFEQIWRQSYKLMVHVSHKETEHSAEFIELRFLATKICLLS